MTPAARGRYTPNDPVAYGAAVQCPGSADGSVLSLVRGTNAELMAEVARLWVVPGDIVADVTYGKGVFWRKLPGVLTLDSDLATNRIDCRALPYRDSTIDVLVFDPPYQPTHGPRAIESGVSKSYRLGSSGLETMNDVLGMYRDGLAEAARVLRPGGGRVLVKCMDMTYNHRLHLVHLDVLRAMVAAGLELADMFVLASTSRMPQRPGRQHRARRAHSYLLVGVTP